MTETLRIFVNGAPVDVPAGTDVRGAIRLFDPTLADQVAAGAASVMDARGLPLAPDAPLGVGAILRVIVSARRPTDAAGQAPE